MRNILVTAALAAWVSGCVYDDAGVDPAIADPLRYRLGGRAVLALEDTSAIAVTATDVDGVALPSMRADIAGGRTAIRTTEEGVLVVEALEIDLADVVVPPGTVSPDAIAVTDLQLRLGIQLAVAPTWSDDGRSAVGTGRADLLLDWSIVNDSGTFPMATRKLEGTPFEVEVYLDEHDDVRARIATSVDGELSRYLDRIALSNFAMTLDATSFVPVD
jgi:hypothetical protein